MDTLLQMTKKMAAAGFIAASTLAFSQNVIYTFETATGASTPLATTNTANVTASKFSRANDKAGVSDLTNGSQSNGYTGASGNYAAAATAKPGALDTGTSTYYEFTLTPDAGYSFNVTRLSFGSRTRISGPAKFSVRSSADNYSKDLASITPASTSWELESAPFTVQAAQPVTFRIYGYGNTGSGSTVADWYVDDVNITVTAVKTVGGVQSVKSGAWSDPATWNTGAVPATDDNVTITAGTEVVAQRKFTQNAAVTINGTLALNDAVTITADLTNNGTLVINNGGGLVQGANSAYLGTGAVKVYKTANVYSDEYNFWSSPVNGFDMANLYDNGSKPQYILDYNTATDYFVPMATGAIAAKGYGVKGSPLATTDPAQSSALFAGSGAGALNNGVVYSPTLKMGGIANINLLGNPYPSTIDAIAMYNANSGRISANLYLWDNTETHGQAQQGASYSGDNYALYNMYSGYGTAAPMGNKTPTQYISLGQGFLVEAIAAEPVVFNNDMRDAAHSPVFYNKANPVSFPTATRSASSKSASAGKSLIVNAAVVTDAYGLVLKTATTTNPTTTITYDVNGSNGVDLGDTPLGSNQYSATRLFSFTDDDPNTRRVLQNRKAPFIVTDSFVLGISIAPAEAGTVSLGFDKTFPNTKGVFANGQAIYLYDSVTNTYTDITKGDYTFNVEAGQYPNRFKILYTTTTLGINENNAGNGVQVYRDRENFVITGSKKITSVEVYDMAGRKVYTAQPNASAHTISASAFANGVYVVKINDGTATVKKIVK